MRADWRRLLVRSRPRFWLYLAGPVLVGVVFAADGVGDLTGWLPAALFLYFLVPANVLLYGVNDVFDADVDEHNPKKDGREVRYAGDRQTVVAVAVSGALGLALAAATPPLARPWLAGFLVLAVGYSAPPLRFKTRPPLDSLSNGLYILPGAAAYATVAGVQPPLLAVVAGWLWTMAMHTFSAVPDIGPDRRAGIQTTATALGERGAYVYCATTWLAAAAVFAVLDPRAGALLAVYPLLVGVVAGTGVSVNRAYWWFPAINALVGMLLTLGGLWGLVRG